MSNLNNDSGLTSLSGFAFQIKVLILYLIKLDNEKQVEFETFEDVVENKTELSNDFIDKKSEYYNTLVKNINNTKAIQVKKTKLNNNILEKVLFNWLILERKENINQFILFTDESYDNKDTLFTFTKEDALFKKIQGSNKQANALITQVKNKFTKLDDFKRTLNSIKNKYEFISQKDIDSKIIDELKNYFHKDGVSNLIYMLRVERLIETITFLVIESAYKVIPFIYTKKDFMKRISTICTQITDKEFNPESFSLFSKKSFINLSDKKLITSREFIQLSYCELTEKRMKEHLLYKEYYDSYRYLMLLNNSEELINDIENISSNNFNDVIDLLDNNNDTPKARLIKTKEKMNSYTCNDNIKFGSCISLTKKDIKSDLQISWKDENE